MEERDKEYWRARALLAEAEVDELRDMMRDAARDGWNSDAGRRLSDMLLDLLANRK